MKRLLFLFLCLAATSAHAQILQLHYDLRHTFDPQRNPTNFPTIYFEYWKQVDSTGGAFFIKTEADLQGQDKNVGKFYTQMSRSLRLWKPKVYLQLQYSGGMGIAEPGSYGYYITNAFSAGPVIPFQWHGTWFSTSLSYQLNTFKKPSNDVMYSMYWGAGLFKYKMEFLGDIELYTMNKNLGDAYTANQHGKRLSLFGEPQLWYNIKKGFAVGTKANMYYHVLTTENVFQVYPTIGVRFKLQ